MKMNNHQEVSGNAHLGLNSRIPQDSQHNCNHTHTILTITDDPKLLFQLCATNKWSQSFQYDPGTFFSLKLMMSFVLHPVCGFAFISFVLDSTVTPRWVHRCSGGPMVAFNKCFTLTKSLQAEENPIDDE